eukprot:Sspe_Gene.37197::Locus_17943_Transcript_1_1_Confidence_1.000_Length_2107::g.37197::m.37197/K08269/ULK2, ATG1; serine/threonine-protein kinase ULK2
MADGESSSGGKSSDDIGKTRVIADRWEVQHSKLGQGNYGKVYLGRDLHTGLPLAVKVTDTTSLSPESRQRVSAEIDILAQIHHPNIVAFYGQLQNDKYQLLMLEYMKGRDLHRYMKKGQAIPPAVVEHLFGDLCEGLKELVGRNVIHRDLKPHNLLLTSSNLETAVLKIADFGFARSLGSICDMARTVAGSPLYMAPEVLEGAVKAGGKGYNNKADLYSVGVILHQMVSGSLPFSGANPHDLLQNINSSRREPLKNVDPAVNKLVDSLLVPDPSKRMEVADFFNDPFVVRCMWSRPSRLAAASAVVASFVVLASTGLVCHIENKHNSRGETAWTAIEELHSGAQLITKCIESTHTMLPALNPLAPPRAVSLYIQAITFVVRAWNALHSQQTTVMQHASLNAWQDMKHRLDDMFHTYCKRANEHLAGLHPDICVEPATAILFDQAKAVSKRAAVEEMLQNKDAAHSMYVHACDVMKLLSGDAPFTPPLPPTQRATAAKCADLLSRRVKKALLPGAGATF